MKIDLNADLGEGCASDSALLQLGLFRQYRLRLSRRRCGSHAAMRARGAEKRRRYWRTPELPGPGKFQSNRDAVTARDGLRPGAVPNWRAGGNRTRPGGELRHVKPHGMLYNQAAKEPPLADAIARAVRDAGRRPGAGWAGGQRAYPRRTALSVDDAPEVFADRGYQADGSLVAA